MAESDDILIRELRKEIRREQVQKIWQRHNGIILSAAVLVILGIAGYEFLEKSRIASAEDNGAKFVAAEMLSANKKKDEAEKAFMAITDSGQAGYVTLAKLRLASACNKDGKISVAVSIYDSIARQAGADDLLKGFAELQAASLRMADAGYDEIQNRLTPLLREDAPFVKSARELLGIGAYKAKKYDEARKYLEPLLIDPNASEDIHERVKVIMGAIAGAQIAANAPPASADTSMSLPATTGTGKMSRAGEDGTQPGTGG